MSEVHEQTLVDAPVSAVWELVGNPRRYARRWMASSGRPVGTPRSRYRVAPRRSGVSGDLNGGLGLVGSFARR